MTSHDQLIILVDNEHGASSHGATLMRQVMLYTKEITRGLNCQKNVYYSHHIENSDLWDNMVYDKHLQQGQNKGEILTDAFTRAFAEGKERVIVINWDCLELESYMIKESFAVLHSNDVVIGPTHQGGYYVLGMRKFLPTLLELKDWNSPDLLMDMILDVKKLNSNYYLLRTLNNLEGTDNFDKLNSIHEKSEDWF